ncbi:Sec-independent protein translocase protein TatB [Marinobacter confluentis]|uniref:Sec-independent protein translocase protein TatB n=1 Tax=Marinobacter confluentis TaxID=1697557 RepID=A0A4Z1CAJ3_9GAMM|nr:Sec-independent protein translocase protein TatB [Marinobacter confluentis]TGN40606.1 twin-arginine translocase subunit TatB [Marinobacter confluentis]
MFDIGFVELLICGVIALIVLGPERLPTAARAAGRWVGAARRMVGQFSSELDSQLKAEELRKELREAGDIGLEDVQKSVRGALDEAKKYEHMVLPDSETPRHRPAPATRRVKESQAQASEPTRTEAPENLEPDEDPSAANNSGHSSLETPEDTSAPREPSGGAPEQSPDKRT